MKIAICYIAVANGPLTADYCSRFVQSYQANPAGAPHYLFVVCNGGPLPLSHGLIFAPIKPLFYPRKNDGGWDISAYIEMAHGACRDADMIVCLGESVYFHRPGWLRRLVEAWEKYGPGMYGCFGTNVIRAHLQTTMFCCPPILLQAYPEKVATRHARYEFEHGERSLWRRAAEKGFPVRLVTWDGEWQPRHFRMPQDILWRGDQSNLLMFCNHSDDFQKADQARKQKWARSADRPYR